MPPEGRGYSVAGSVNVNYFACPRETPSSWQIFRGMVTFPLRTQRIFDTAQTVAEWLEQRENVTYVSYPGLPSNPGHEVAKKQMQNGFGGVISFVLNTDDKSVGL